MWWEWRAFYPVTALAGFPFERSATSPRDLHAPFRLDYRSASAWISLCPFDVDLSSFGMGCDCAIVPQRYASRRLRMTIAPVGQQRTSTSASTELLRSLHSAIAQRLPAATSVRSCRKHGNANQCSRRVGLMVALVVCRPLLSVVRRPLWLHAACCVANCRMAGCRCRSCARMCASAPTTASAAACE